MRCSTRNRIGDNDGGTGVVAGLLAGKDEDAGANDGAKAEPDEVPPVKAPLHGVLAFPLQLHHLHLLRGAAQEPFLEAVAGLGQCGPVGV